jgi:NADH dehydrogenase
MPTGETLMILLLGATGLLGRQVLRRLMKNRWPVRVLSRGQADWQSDLVNLRAQGVEIYYASFNEPERLEGAFRNCTAVINTIGCMSAKRLEHLRAANLEVVEKIVEMVSLCNVQRVIQVGCLGASEKSASEYFKFKWLADEAVKRCPAYWTILRPSYIFGEQFALLQLVKPLLRFRPFLPVIGSGLNLIEPVWVEDVADCILLSLYDKSSVGQVYELTGPEEVTMIELQERFRNQMGLIGPTVNVPSNTTAYVATLLAKVMPTQLFHPDLVPLLTSDSVSQRNDLKDKFGINGASLTERLPELAKLLA